MGSMAAEFVVGIANGEIEAGSLEKYFDSGSTTVTIDNAEEAMEKAF
jgi:hypothetical protein